MREANACVLSSKVLYNRMMEFQQISPFEPIPQILEWSWCYENRSISWSVWLSIGNLDEGPIVQYVRESLYERNEMEHIWIDDMSMDNDIKGSTLPNDSGDDSDDSSDKVILTIVVLLFLIFRFLRERGKSHINSYHTVKRGGIVLYWL